MFTGIIEEIGTINSISKSGNTLKIDIAANHILTDIKLGDSIAVNGVCLTVTAFKPTSFCADVMPITFNVTTLHQLKSGAKVNLERAMAANGRFGGHIVSGHIDCVGQITSKTISENAIILTISCPIQYLQYCIEKGSIALDRKSLTLSACSKDNIQVSLIPHTQDESIIGSKNIGESLNIEFDSLAKLILKATQTTGKSSNISMSFLKDNGFL